MPRWLLLSFVVSGCSTTATIVTRDGIDEASIVDGDRHHLKLESPSGAQKVVQRARVKDIDHPGNVHALVGGITAGLMVLELIVFGAVCSSTSGPGQASCATMLGAFGALGAGGLGMFTWGLWAWMGSTNKVRDTVDGPPLEGVAEPPPEGLQFLPPPSL